MEWVVQLSGDSGDLEELSKVFTTPELCISKDKDNFLLKSEEFRSCSSPDEVRKISADILTSMNAGILLSLDARKKLENDGILQIDDAGHKHYFLKASVSAHMRCSASMSILHADGTEEVFHPADPVQAWIKIAATDAKVTKAFSFINNDFNSWYGLYKVLEVLEEDHFGPVMRGGKYKKMADEFTKTANSFTTTGIDARHATERAHPIPKKPMTLSEAKSFFKMLLQEWLREKESRLL
jgi:hypothetical protein